MNVVVITSRRGMHDIFGVLNTLVREECMIKWGEIPSLRLSGDLGFWNIFGNSGKFVGICLCFLILMNVLNRNSCHSGCSDDSAYFKNICDSFWCWINNSSGDVTSILGWHFRGFSRELVEPGLGRLDGWTPKTWTNLGNFVQSMDYFQQTMDYAS